MKNTAFILLLSFASFNILAQKPDKMKKNLKVFVNENFDRKSLFVFERTIDDGSVIGAFKNAFTVNGFKVISETSTSRTAEIEESKNKRGDTTERKLSLSTTNYVKANYIVTISYDLEVTNDRGFIQGGVQCKNIRGQIVDLDNESQIIATFSYIGNFDADPVANAVATELSRSSKK
jgi:lipocalin